MQPNATAPRGSTTTAVIATLLVVVVLGLGAWWLVRQAGAAGRPPGPTVVTGDTAGQDFPRTVALPGGGTLRVEAPPGRVVPAGSAAADLVVALVGPDRVAGLPRPAFLYTEFPGGPERWEHLPRFERYLAEPLLALEPDLVIAHRWQEATPTSLLTAAGVPVLILPDAADLPAMLDQLQLVGAVLGTEQHAAEVRADIEARVAALAEGASARSGWTALFYSNQGVGGWTAAGGTTHDAMLTMAGVTNAAALAGLAGHASIDLEQLIVVDPDVIIVAGKDGDSATQRYLAETPAAGALTAIREQRIVVLPPSLYGSASHHIVSGAERIAEALDALLAREQH